MAVNTTIQVTLPAMGESVTEGTVLEWHKQEGDQVEADETLVEVSTDKVDAEVPAPASGTVVKIHAAEGDTVQVGAVLAAGTITEILAEEGATVTVGQVIARMQLGAGKAAPARDEAGPESGNGAGAATPGASETAVAVPDDARISPVARRVAEAEGVDVEA